MIDLSLMKFETLLKKVGTVVLLEIALILNSAKIFTDKIYSCKPIGFKIVKLTSINYVKILNNLRKFMRCHLITNVLHIPCTCM